MGKHMLKITGNITARNYKVKKRLFLWEPQLLAQAVSTAQAHSLLKTPKQYSLDYWTQWSIINSPEPVLELLPPLSQLA